MRQWELVIGHVRKGHMSHLSPGSSTADQMHHVDVSTELQQLASEEETLPKVVTGNVSWIYGHDIETKHQSSQQKSSGSPKA